MYLRGLLPTVLLASALLPVAADEAQLGNRERLSGTILGMKGNKLRFGSDALGEVQVPWRLVKDVRSDNNLAVYAEGGKVLVGILSGMRDGTLQVQTQKGLVAVDPREVLEISTDLPRGENPAPKVEWRGRAEFGFGYITGNTQRQEFSVGGELHRKGAVSELAFKVLAEQGQTGAKRDLARATLGTSYNWAGPGRSYFSWDMSHEHDDIRSLRLRGNYALSFGYRFVDRAPNTWVGEYGVNYTHENYIERRSSEVTMRMSSQTQWRILGNAQLGFNLVAYPNPSAISHLRTNSELSLSFPLTEAVDLVLSLNDDYDSEPPEGVRPNDLRARTSLAYSF